MTTRCGWATKSPELMFYHDTRWGKPTREVDSLFEAMCLEIMQAGLAFQVILKHEVGMRAALEGFSITKLAMMGPSDIDRLCNDKRMIRNRLKITAIIENAKVLVNSPQKLIDATWAPVHFVPLDHLLTTSAHPQDYSAFIAQFMTTFRAMGIKRMGPITTYSYLQAVGVVNDHIIDCQFR